MRNLQPVTWPAGAKQMDAWLAFLDDPEAYKKLHDALAAHVEEYNSLVEKLGLAGDIRSAREGATRDLAEARKILEDAKEKDKAERADQLTEQKRLSAVEMALVEREKDFKQAVKSHEAAVAKHINAEAKAHAELEEQRAAVKTTMERAKTLQNEAKSRIDTIREFAKASA